jgi:hypothetical protein
MRACTTETAAEPRKRRVASADSYCSVIVRRIVTSSCAECGSAYAGEHARQPLSSVGVVWVRVGLDMAHSRADLGGDLVAAAARPPPRTRCWQDGMQWLGAHGAPGRRARIELTATFSSFLLGKRPSRSFEKSIYRRAIILFATA